MPPHLVGAAATPLLPCAHRPTAHVVSTVTVTPPDLALDGRLCHRLRSHNHPSSLPTPPPHAGTSSTPPGTGLLLDLGFGGLISTSSLALVPRPLQLGGQKSPIGPYLQLEFVSMPLGWRRRGGRAAIAVVARFMF
uniref:Uncharacterized protein n=1 Tax=Oryza glumipatula TaxID=40148 RepID=A0A0E0B177_9ORYZ